ncbi:MAG TPA: 1,4-dihydroxy-2-naphthoate polyprenyltransferase [Egibacteraceae bacterium]|nr:1,4-dihydroxy-2-naphthoate polyprenyltransferase [Egibacteraceae bacterium]
MSRASVYWEAARPRTLPAAVAPVLVGTAAAERFLPGRLLLALVVGLALQVGVNYANDYFDGVRGVDTPERVGPRRAVASGLVAPAAMRAAMLVAFGLAGAAGLALALLVEPWLLAVGAVCLAAAAGYSGGPRPYASAGMGELFVFVFFGLVATVGSAYAQDERVVGAAVAGAVPMGLLASAILVVNNLRDITTDARAGKRTLAVRLGRGRTRLLFAALVAGAFAAVPAIAALDGAVAPLLALAAAPLAVPPLRIVWTREEPRPLIAALGGTARLELAVGVLLAAGLWLS